MKQIKEVIISTALSILRNSFIQGGLFLITSYLILRFLNVNSERIPFYLAILATLSGYFIINNLEISRKTKEKKLELCLDLIKSLRLYLNEPYYLKKEGEMRKYRDSFIDASYSFSLLISNESNLLLQALVKAYKDFMDSQVIGSSNADQIGKSKEAFAQAQNNFINSLRKEFSIKGDIDFRTYAISLPGEP